jgi:hypothetical protein
MGSPAALSGALRSYETTQKRNAGFIRQKGTPAVVLPDESGVSGRGFIDRPAARDGCGTALLGSGTKSNGPRAFPLEKNLVDDNNTDFCHQAVRAWKALVEIADNERVAPLLAAWAKARIDPLDPGAAIRPALSPRPQAERPIA